MLKDRAEKNSPPLANAQRPVETNAGASRSHGVLQPQTATIPLFAENGAAAANSVASGGPRHIQDRPDEPLLGLGVLLAIAPEAGCELDFQRRVLGGHLGM
jgi:hypothetical protein